MFLEQVEFVEFALEELLVGELGLVFGDEGGAEVAVHGVFDDFGILAGAEQHADGGVFVGLFRIAVEGFEIEAELAEVFRLEAPTLSSMATRQFRPRWKKRRSSAKSRPPTWSGNSVPMKQKSRPSSMRKSRSWSSRP
jgi:hypothetical protein